MARQCWACHQTGGPYQRRAQCGVCFQDWGADLSLAPLRPVAGGAPAIVAGGSAAGPTSTRTTAAARVAGAPMLGPEDRILDDEQYKQWKANETPAARRKRLTDNSTIWLSRLGEFVVSPPRAALRRRLALKRGLKRHLASMRARRRLGDALAGVRGLIRDARNERTRRIGRASGATRTSTVIATVLSRLATLRPARPRAQASLPPRRRTAVHRAAALGPATSGLIASYERLGYG